MGSIVSLMRARRMPPSALRSSAARTDPAAFTALYEAMQGELYRYCRSIVRHDEDARDLVQTTFAKAFSALGAEARDFELRPWLFRIAHNEAISLLRRRRDADELGAADHLSDGATVSEAFELREDLRLLQADLAELPERQRAALLMRELNGLGHDEIATALESSPRAIKQVIFEARTALHECREGRALACDGIRRTLSDGDRRALRGRKLRAHLRGCSDCAAFGDAVTERPKQLAALFPPVPLATGALLFDGGSVAHAATAAAPAASASSAAAVTAGGGLLAATGAKLVVTVAVLAGAFGGTAAVGMAARDDAAARPQAATAEPETGDPSSSAEVPSGGSDGSSPEPVRGTWTTRRDAGTGARARPTDGARSQAGAAGTAGRGSSVSASPPAAGSTPPSRPASSTSRGRQDDRGPSGARDSRPDRASTPRPQPATPAPARTGAPTAPASRAPTAPTAATPSTDGAVAPAPAASDGAAPAAGTQAGAFSTADIAPHAPGR